MLSPVRTLFLHFPLRAYSTVLLMLAVSVLVFWQVRKRGEPGTMSRRHGMLWWALLNYAMLVLFLTVLGRRSWDYYRYNFQPLYSYLEVWTTGDRRVVLGIGANIAVFVPLGFLGTLAPRRWGFFKGLAMGILLSACIEALQLVLRSGTCEVDDLISNTAGTLIGCVLAAPCRSYFYKKQRM